MFPFLSVQFLMSTAGATPNLYLCRRGGERAVLVTSTVDILQPPDPDLCQLPPELSGAALG